MMMQIKVYDYQHTYIDTLVEFNQPQTINTLNGVNKMTFTVPLQASKTNEMTIRLGNHIEFFYKGVKTWWGIIVSTGFNGGQISVGCYGYAHLLEHRRLLEKEYPLRRYDELIKLMLDDANSLDSSGITHGSYELCKTKTQRTTHATDFTFKKMCDYANDINAYLSIDDTLKLHFAMTIPQNRVYVAKWGDTELSNITNPPTLSLSLTDVANDVYAEIDTRDEEGQTIKQTYRLKNEESISLYGVHHGVASVSSGVSEATTLQSKVEESLKTTSFPSSSISLEIVDTILAPIDELKVGHHIHVELDYYFNFKTTSRILEITRDYTKNVAKITVGSTLYRQQPPTVIVYKP